MRNAFLYLSIYIFISILGNEWYKLLSSNTIHLEKINWHFLFCLLFSFNKFFPILSLCYLSFHFLFWCSIIYYLFQLFSYSEFARQDMTEPAIIPASDKHTATVSKWFLILDVVINIFNYLDYLLTWPRWCRVADKGFGYMYELIDLF